MYTPALFAGIKNTFGKLNISAEQASVNFNHAAKPNKTNCSENTDNISFYLLTTATKFTATLCGIFLKPRGMSNSKLKHVIKIKQKESETIFENPKLKDYVFLLIYNLLIHLINKLFSIFFI